MNRSEKAAQLQHIISTILLYFIKETYILCIAERKGQDLNSSILINLEKK